MGREYRTKDLAEAAALVTGGCRLIQVERVGGGIAWFIFDGESGCRKLADEFYFGGLVGSLKLFSENLRTLKGRLFVGG